MQDKKEETMRKESATTAKLKLITQYVSHIEFKVGKSSHELSTLLKEIKPEITFQILPGYRHLDNNFYEVSIEAVVHSKVEEEKTEIFTLNITYCGICQLEGEGFENDKTEKILLINVVTLIFQFLRKEVAGIILSGGYPAIMLDPVDFEKFYYEYQSKSKKDEREELTDFGKEVGEE